MDFQDIESNCVRVAGQQLADRTIAKHSEIPQVEKMLSISEIPDDKGMPLEAHWVKALTNGNISSVLVEIDNKELLLQPKLQDGTMERVPHYSHFVRDEETQEQIVRIPAVKGG